MKQLFFFFVLLLPFCVQAQISEPFDGPEITSANPWKVGEGFHLSGGRLSFDGSGQKGWKSCALPIRYTPDMQWTFDVDLAFRSSNLNNARIYVYATAKPSDVAFFVQVGHNDHSVSFYEYRGTNTPERVIRGREGLLGDGASSVRVRLTLERNRLWTLYTSTDKRHFVKEGEVEIPLPADDIRPGGFFHLACFYKAISLTGMVFSFDNVEISSEIDLPEADLILLSLDGDRERHNAIRGDTYDAILENIRRAPSDNICLYMAINQINKDAIRHVCRIARDTPHVRAVSFNFHTPYPGTEDLALSREEKAACCAAISEMIREGAPVFNLQSAFPYLIHNRFPTPCRQCVVMEAGKLSVCGRCVDSPSLCHVCGYFFAAEYALLFRGNPRIVLEMLKTYPKYI